MLESLSKCNCQNLEENIYRFSFYDTVLKDIGNAVVELEYINKKTNEIAIKTYSQTVIDKLYMLLNKGFKIAFSDRLIQFNPLDNESIKKPKSKKETKKVEALTVDEQKTCVYFKRNQP